MAVASIAISRACTGKCTTFLKVKAHSDMHGNDQADAAAKLAVSAIAANVNLPTVVLGQQAHANQHWIQQICTLGDGTTRVRNLSNLETALGKLIHANTRCRLGTSNTSATYFDLLHNTRTYLCNHANAITQTPQGAYYPAWRAAIKFRMGLTWSAKLARRYRTQGVLHDGICPLCGESDGGTHILLECGALKSYHIARHDAAVAIVTKALLKSAIGNYYLVADINASRLQSRNKNQTKDDKTQAQACAEQLRLDFDFEIPDTSSHAGNTSNLPASIVAVPPAFPMAIPKRIPSWLLTTGARPDLLMVDGIPHDFRHDANSPLTTLPPAGIRKIHIIELGYCNLSAWQEKREQKLEQHDTGNNLKPDLVESLSRTYGQRATTMVQLHALPLAVCGLALEHNLEALQLLGMERAQALRCMTKLSRSAMTSMQTIVRERHRLCASKAKVPTPEWRDPG